MRCIAAGSPAIAHPAEDFVIEDYLKALSDGFIGGTSYNDIDPEELNRISVILHSANVHAGWWTDLSTGKPMERNVPELLCLMHSEISEALEGHRKGLMDDKLTYRPMIEVELADVLIRLFDTAGALELDLGGAVLEKLEFNAHRADHKIENRIKDGGKKL